MRPAARLDCARLDWKARASGKLWRATIDEFRVTMPEEWFDMRAYRFTAWVQMRRLTKEKDDG